MIPINKTESITPRQFHRYCVAVFSNAEHKQHWAGIAEFVLSPSDLRPSPG